QSVEFRSGRRLASARMIRAPYSVSLAFSTQSRARLFQQLLLTTSALLFTSLLRPPEGGGQHAVNFLVVHEAELPQHGHLNGPSGQFLDRQELVHRLEDPDVILFFHVVLVTEVFPTRSSS